MTNNGLRGTVLLLLPGVALGCAVEAPSRETTASDSSALTVCASGVTVPGIDVSKWDGTVQWPAVAASGQRFGIARVSDGTTYPDATFASHWSAIKGAGLVRGAYQFFRPEEDPVAQANLVLSALASDPIGPGDLPVILDIETVDGVSSTALRAHVQTWLDRIEQGTGKRPIVYTAAFMSSALGTGFGTYPLWVANYGVTCPLLPAGWDHWLMWQYGGSTSVPGISSNVDLNVFNGSLADLDAFVSNGGNKMPPSWSCASSAYHGQQLWTCSDGNLFECEAGVPVQTSCAKGCVTRSVGKADLCIDGASNWSCSASAYAGTQLWTCSAGDIYRCANGAPERVVCPQGCISNAIGLNDSCQ